MPFNVRACVVCEQARPEALGKWTLLGVFGLAPTVRIAITNFQLPITLCFVFMGDEFSGHVHASIRVLAPSGRDIAIGVPPIDGDVPRERPLTMLFLAFQALADGPGQYTVVLEQNGEDVYRNTFWLDQAAQPVQPVQRVQ